MAVGELACLQPLTTIRLSNHRIHEAAIVAFGIDNGSHLLDVLWQLNERASCRHLVPVKTDIDDSHRVKLYLGLHIGVSCRGSDTPDSGCTAPHRC